MVGSWGPTPHIKRPFGLRSADLSPDCFGFAYPAEFRYLAERRAIVGSRDFLDGFLIYSASSTVGLYTRYHSVWAVCGPVYSRVPSAEEVYNEQQRRCRYGTSCWRCYGSVRWATKTECQSWPPCRTNVHSYSDRRAHLMPEVKVLLYICTAIKAIVRLNSTGSKLGTCAYKSLHIQKWYHNRLRSAKSHSRRNMWKGT